ncbi:MAG: SOS response-associated peptidase [Parvularculaceae bacterium]
MCGRYHQAAPAERLGREFDLDIRENFPARYNICPTQPISIVHMNEKRQRQYSLMRWGFIPSWAKKDYLDKLAVRPLINARADGIELKPAFRHAFRRRRCLIPATGFYEWTGAAGAKQPHNIVRRDGDLFAFAGLWETAHDADGGEIDTVAIITTDAGPDIRDLHDREPVVIARDAYRFWLETGEKDSGMTTSLLMAPKAGFWRTYAVSKAVNSAKNDGPELVAPLAA